jgi:hypothetical protein
LPHRMSRAELAWRVTGFYYDHLNEDERFRADLAALFARLEASGAPDPLTGEGRRLWEEAQHGTPDLMVELAEAYKGTPLGERYRLALSICREVETFISRWPLPGRIWDDLRWSYALHLRWGKGKGKRPRLELGGFAEFLPSPGLPIEVGVHKVGGTTVRVVERQPWIFPSHPLPFLYDPVRQDRKWLEEVIEAICREVRESILEQARLYEEDVGAYWWKPGPRYRKGHEEWLAYILYLRVVRRDTWGELMKLATESGFYSEGDDVDLLRKRVTSLARLIGLPLRRIA